MTGRVPKDPCPATARATIARAQGGTATSARELAERLAASREIIADAREVLRSGCGPKARSPGEAT